MKKELIIILDFGGQYNQLIARRVRELNVYCEVYPYNLSIDEIKSLNPDGIILTGGPNSVYEKDSPKCDKKLFELNIPVLGICYGAQLMAYTLNGSVKTSLKSEYGKKEIEILDKSCLFRGLSDKSITWMSHTDYIDKIPEGFVVTSKTNACPVASMKNTEKNLYAVQFHPEVTHSVDGKNIIKNFLYDICNVKGNWAMKSFVEDAIQNIKEKVKNKKALLALSGGVDSSVAAILMEKAIGKNLTCVFVDTGLLRKNEAKEIKEIFSDKSLNFISIDAKNRFYRSLNNVEDPETKRKIIGNEFIHIFEEEAKKIGEVDFLVQGTIYPDVIESGLGKSDVIKSHHNVGGLPDNIEFKEIIEPLRMLFKDEVRKAGLELGLPKDLVYRQPFPGPGLGIRIIGEVTPEKIKIVQEADYIFREEIKKANLDKVINQYFAALTNMKSVGVKGDFRTYDYAIVLRAVTTSDFMTAESFNIPYEVLDIVTRRIVNEVKNVNRVLYDLTGKPPATIELE